MSFRGSMQKFADLFDFRNPARAKVSDPVGERQQALRDSAPRPRLNKGGHYEAPSYSSAQSASEAKPRQVQPSVARVPSQGVITAVGTSPFNYRGMRQVDTASVGRVLEYDPRQDHHLTILKRTGKNSETMQSGGTNAAISTPGGPMLPKHSPSGLPVSQGVLVSDKYRPMGSSGVGYVTYAPSTPRAVTSVRNWQTDIVAQFPDIGKAGTQLNAAFVAAYKTRGGNPENAMALAMAVGKEFGITPTSRIS